MYQDKRDPSRHLPLLLLLFAGSGCSALIYEIVWYQMLQLALGSTAVSLGVLLATFMGGLCLGSIGVSRMRLEGRHPVRTYAAIEAGIALFGLLALLEIPLIDRIYISGIEHGLPGVLLRGIVAAVCMLPPTILMGASLPVMARWIKTTPRGVSWWGFLYGANTVGAVFGCLLAGFYLLRIYNVAIATYAAVAINLVVAALSLGLAARTPAQISPGGGSERPSSVAGAWGVYVAIALSGACALGAEVVWTRLMGMLLGATVYVFAIILGVFLVGLAMGSAGGSWLARETEPRRALGWCQALLSLAIAWTVYMISDSLPYWPINPLLVTTPWHTFQIDLVRCLWAILPPTILWGASFPLALAAAAQPGEDAGRVVGAVYAANTFGAILGALGFSLALIPWAGTQQAQRLLLVLSAAAAVVALAPYLRSRAVAVWLAASLIVAGALTWKVDKVPGELIAYGRRMASWTGQSEILYTVEGRNSSVAISRWADGAIFINVNGHVEATTEPYDMKLQRMVGHLPGVLHPNPKSVLGIGFGAGVSAGTFTRYPTIEKLTVCEIEPVIPPTSTRFFAKQNYTVMRNPRTTIVYDDARHYLMTTTSKFDIIASDPLDVFVKGTAALYSKEYFEAVKRHLNPGGMFTLYVPLYETDAKTVQSELATFFDAFPGGTIWANTRDGEGYDMIFMGQVGPLQIDLDQVTERLARPDYAPVVESLREISIYSPMDMFSTYAGQLSDLAPWLAGAEINRDRDLRLQYLAGWSINSNLQDQIYREILKYRRPPSNLFSGSPQRVQALIYALSLDSGGR